MPEITLNEELNRIIADLLLGCTDSGMSVYAGTYIKHLEEKVKNLEEQLKKCQEV